MIKYCWQKKTQLNLNPPASARDVPCQVHHLSRVVMGAPLGDNVIRHVSSLSHVWLQLVDPLCRHLDALTRPSTQIKQILL
jgi:hypothetical protein